MPGQIRVGRVLSMTTAIRSERAVVGLSAGAPVFVMVRCLSSDVV
jgi:hypothetical protein